MSSDFEIGRVVAVDTAQVTIELNADLKGLTRGTYEGPQDVGRINSYVIVPVGARRLVAMVSRIVLAEEAELHADRTMVTLPAARRVMKATLIGTIDGYSFTQGISLFPVLDSPAYLAAHADLDSIFGPAELAAEGPPHPDKPGFCVPLGESAVVQGRHIRIDPDAFFGKHAAVLGSTGSGKSCTIASLIQSIMDLPQIKRTMFVILDTNGEYRRAFQRQNDTGTWEDATSGSCLYIPSDPLQMADKLVVPYWFLNADDFVHLFQAAPTLQRPVLIDAVRRAREGTLGAPSWRSLRADVIAEVNRIIAHSRGSDKADAKAIRRLADGLHEYLEQEAQRSATEELTKLYPTLRREDLLAMASQFADIAREGITSEGGQYESYAPVDVGKRNRIRGLADPILKTLSSFHSDGSGIVTAATADMPTWFDRDQFRDSYLSQAMDREESGRARDHCATLLLRVHRLLEDPRFEFLFGPILGQWPSPQHSLASLLRDLLGLRSREEAAPPLSTEIAVPPGQLPYYDRQRGFSEGHDVVVLDLSLLAAEVLENVTALIGRLILEFLQRLGEYGGEEMRGSLPIVLVLEEAQNYIREQRGGQEESISRVVFERVAREGRKYGLSLVVASQRPSELSKTVLSQCSSFIVHRLQNPEDLRYFKEIVPGIYGPMLDQLPALAPQTALVLGECVPAPSLVHIREARPVPRSRDPKFYKYWTDAALEDPPVEEVCARWEGKTALPSEGIAGSDEEPESESEA